MKCPMCKLENPPEAERCDCGYDFVHKELRPTYLTKTEIDSKAVPTNLQWIICYLTCLGGGLIGILYSYSLANRKSRTNPKAYQYNEKSRKTARKLMVVSIVMTIFWTIFRLFPLMINKG